MCKRIMQNLKNVMCTYLHKPDHILNLHVEPTSGSCFFMSISRIDDITSISASMRITGSSSDNRNFASLNASSCSPRRSEIFIFNKIVLRDILPWVSSRQCCSCMSFSASMMFGGSMRNSKRTVFLITFDFRG